jgi:hypothetical protein
VVGVGKRDAGEPDKRAPVGLRRAHPRAHWRMFALLLALVMLSGAQRTAAALAADGLPPGVPVPSWAKGKRVHFDLAEPHNPRRIGGDVRLGAAGGVVAASSAKVAPLTSSPPRLVYHGGTIQNEPHLMLVFLGQEWESGSALSLRHELEATAESLPGSKYQEILTQYSGLEGPISSPLSDFPVIEKYYVKRPITTKITSYAARQAAQEVIQQTGGAEKTDTTYAILPAPGTIEVESRTCGFHEEYGSNEAGPSIAAIMDTEERIGCGTPTQALTHEYAESVTDPNGVSGWNTGQGVGSDEIGDICNGLGAGRLANGARVAYLWDDSKNACEVEDGTPGSLPIGPYAQGSHRNPSLEGSTNLTPESEVLETSIYPCDLEAHYYFEYGPTETYGSKTAESAVPAKWGGVKVSVTVAGLQHSTPYHWRVVVKTSHGTAEGVDHEFTIPYYVEIKERGATNVGLSEATLNGEVQPVGVEAKYYFEYGTTEAYGSRTSEASAGSGNAFVEVSAVLSGLQLGTIYHYRLVASSSRGTTVGADQRFETHGGKPVVETSHTRFVRYTEARLGATVDAKGVPTTFYFEYGTTAAYGHLTEEESLEEDRAEEEGATISGLEPATVYHFRIVATNSYGTSYGADESFSTHKEPLVETGAPSAVGYETATLNGAINPHGTKTGYYFEYGTSQAYGEATAEVNAGLGTSEIQIAQTVSHLAQDTTYHFRLVATTLYGNFYGADHVFVTGTKPLVQTNVPKGVGSTEATFTGTLNPYGAQASYYFEYGLTSGYGLTTAQVNVGAGSGNVEASQAVAELSPGVTYHYRLVAVFGSVKQYGSEITFATMPLAPIVEPIGPALPATPLSPPTTPLSPPTKAAAPASPTPDGPTRLGVSLHVAQHGNSLLVSLGLDGTAARVEVDAIVPGAQLGKAKSRGHRVSVVLARTVRINVEVGQSKLVLPLDLQGRRALRHRRRMTLTVTVTVTSSGGERQTTARTLALSV